MELTGRGAADECQRRFAARSSFLIVDMAVTCQVSYTFPVLTVVSDPSCVSQSSFVDLPGGTVFERR